MMEGYITFQSDELDGRRIPAKTQLSHRKLRGTAKAGKIADIIGDGDNAKNSFVWIAVRWSFIIGGLITSALFIRSGCVNVNIFEDIKGVWDIFIPVITLALGYAFGKGK